MVADAPTTSLQVVAISLAVGSFFLLLVGMAEALHFLRIRGVRHLAFGPSQRPSVWVWAAPFLRSIFAGCLAASLTVLFLLPPISHRKDGTEVAFEKLKHVLLVLDVSPSMRLQDAGKDKGLSRMKQARDVMESYFQRVPMAEFRVTVVAVYTDAFPVVRETKDAAVVQNILNDLPMHYAFVPGETDLFSGIRVAAKTAKGWRPKSATMVIVTDGDTVPATGMPRLPASVADVLVVGVGDAQKGSFINGRNSRQDVSTLRQVAARLGGVYHNGNQKQLSTALIEGLTEKMEGEGKTDLTVREAALMLAAVSLFVIVGLPFALHYLGTTWQPGARKRRLTIEQSVPASTAPSTSSLAGAEAGK